MYNFQTDEIATSTSLDAATSCVWNYAKRQKGEKMISK